MIKGMILGVLIMIGLVGYGVIDTATIEDGGQRVKNGVNYIAKSLDEATR
jgi:hypothetical protein